MNGKCKIWDTESKKWFKPVYQKPNSKNEYFEELLISMSGEVCMRRFTVGEKEIEFKTFPNADNKKEQRFLPFYYTGLKDSEDSKIYFKDILEYDGNIFIVEWDKEGTIYGDTANTRINNLDPMNFQYAKVLGHVMDKT
jgi:hypothetical protein